MENQPLLLVLGIGALLVMLAFIMMRHWRREHVLTEAYRRAANRWGGRFKSDGWFGNLSFTFRHRGVSVLVETYSTGTSHPKHGDTRSTRMKISWPDGGIRLEIYPQRFSERVGKLFGLIDLEVGSPDFDRDFIITGNTQDVRDLLTPEVQHLIRRLRWLGDDDHIYISIGHGRLVAAKLKVIRDEWILNQWIEGVMALYDHIVENERTGIEVVSVSLAASDKEVICQVCGEAIAAPMVRCSRCQTLHHEDCWHYFGGCSTFGCGGRRYIAS